MDEIKASTNAHEFSLAVDTQTTLCLLIKHDQPVHVCDIEIKTGVQHVG